MHVFVPLLLGYNSSHLPTPSLKGLIALRKKKKEKKTPKSNPLQIFSPRGIREIQKGQNEGM